MNALAHGHVAAEPVVAVPVGELLLPTKDALLLALAAGGQDEGAPGLRDFGPNYYGAYVRDLDGNKIHFVCREEPADNANSN